MPVYYQIKEKIKGWIIRGEYKPGEKIPSESQLSKKFDVSRLTVRRSLAQLESEGFLNTKQGQGSFVTYDEKLINSFNLEFTGFIDDLFYQIQKTTTKTVEKKKIEVPDWLRDKLEIDKEEKLVTRFKRIRMKNNKIFAFTVNFLPSQIGEKIEKEELLKKPLLQIMEKDLGIKFGEAFQTIEASFADEEVAEKLQIALGLPILFVERVMYNEKGRPVELVQSAYRGDLYKYVVRLKNVTRKKENMWMHNAGDTY